MKQSISATWIFQLVIIFTLIFAAYIALTINYSRAFKVKDEVISLIEKNQGMTDNGIKLINNYLNSIGYKTKGKCHPVDNYVVYGVKSIDVNAVNQIEKMQPSKDYYYCFTKYANYHLYFKSRAYYRVTMFFRFDLPVFGDLYSFDIDGQTSEIDATFDGGNLENWS